MGIFPPDYWSGGSKCFFNFYQPGQFEQHWDFNSENLDNLGRRVCRLAFWPDWFTCLVAMETEKKSGRLQATGTWRKDGVSLR